MRSWIKILLRLWRGDEFHEAIKRSEDTRKEARAVLDNVRETLDGECDWVWGPKDGQTDSNSHQT